MISQVIIDVVGWIYFSAWSLSFYGQLILNWRLKNVQGMNLDFLAMNLTGFSFYSLYCSYGYFNAAGSAQTGTVDLNDLIFAYHALFVTLLTVTQAFIYPKGKNKIMNVTIAYLIALWVFCMVWSVLTMGTKTYTPPTKAGVISLMGYFKLSISFLKYLPQMYWNYKRKSTVGWSIANILLDFTGGFFSFLQMTLEALNGKETNLNQLNAVKLVLAIMCMFYDIIFMIQHYCLYPQRKQLKEIEDNYQNLTSENEIKEPNKPLESTQVVSSQAQEVKQPQIKQEQIQQDKPKVQQQQLQQV